MPCYRCSCSWPAPRRSRSDLPYPRRGSPSTPMPAAATSARPVKRRRDGVRLSSRPPPLLRGRETLARRLNSRYMLNRPLGRLALPALAAAPWPPRQSLVRPPPLALPVRMAASSRSWMTACSARVGCPIAASSRSWIVARPVFTDELAGHQPCSWSFFSCSRLGPSSSRPSGFTRNGRRCI